MILSDKLKNQISLLPNKPGVYQMKDKDDVIIYIGKAKNLKNRVSQYFLRPQSGKVAAMVNNVDHFDFIIVDNEKESFILEMNLIQTHYPRYNIMLMDDSHYPYIALKKGNDPLLKIARNTKNKNFFYFGPYPSSSSAYESINLLNRIFKTRKCNKIPNKPCLYYSLGQCLGQCINKIDEITSLEIYNSIKKFLNGDVGEVKKELTSKMDKAIEELNFEIASEYKKTLDSISYVISDQNVEGNSSIGNKDFIVFSSRESYVSIAILTYRKGRLLGKSTHVVPSFGDIGEQLLDLSEQYYSNHDYPKEIVTRLESLKDLEEDLDDVKVLIPKEGRLVDIISLAELNAKQALDAHFASAKLEDNNLELLNSLGTLLGIKIPLRIELFDNSHLNGSSPVAAMVCFINGEPAKKLYRKYHLDEENGGDDYHSMVEITGRRYKRLKEEDQILPDLILTDGGLAQVHATLETLSALNMSIPVFGLFKNDKHQTSGLIDSDSKIYEIDRKSPLFFLLMRMQDEVHRFAISFHKQQRNKNMKNDILDKIEGIGDKRKEQIRKHYPTYESLIGASIDELAQILPEKVAKNLFKELHNNL